MGNIFEYEALTQEELEGRAMDQTGFIPDVLAVIVQIDVAMGLADRLEEGKGPHKHQVNSAIDHLSEAKDSMMYLLPGEAPI